MDIYQTARSMSLTQLRLFVDPNMKAYVEVAATLNQKRIGRVIDKLQEAFCFEKNPSSNTKCMIEVNFPVNTEVIVVHGDGQSACGRPVRKSTKATHYGADACDEAIKFRPYKMQKNVFDDVGSLGFHTDRQRRYEAAEINEQRKRIEGSKETCRELLKSF